MQKEQLTKDGFAFLPRHVVHRTRVTLAVQISNLRNSTDKCRQKSRRFPYVDLIRLFCWLISAISFKDFDRAVINLIAKRLPHRVIQ